MEYWLSVIDEMADQTGVDFSDAQRTIAATSSVLLHRFTANIQHHPSLFVSRQ